MLVTLYILFRKYIITAYYCIYVYKFPIECASVGSQKQAFGWQTPKYVYILMCFSDAHYTWMIFH